VHSSRVHSSRVHSSRVHSSRVHSSRVHSTGVHSTGVHSTGVYSTGVHSTGVHSTGVHSTGVHSKEQTSMINQIRTATDGPDAALEIALSGYGAPRSLTEALLWAVVFTLRRIARAIEQAPRQSGKGR
jgi:hypothetical protein